VKVYLDGEACSLHGKNDSQWAAHFQSVRVWIGRGPSSFFKGVLDEVYMYKQAMGEPTIDRQVQGFGELAGRHVRIYNNTFHSSVHPIIAVHGDPLEKVEIHHNWFVNGKRGRAVDQWNGRKNVVMFENAYGQDALIIEPRGTPRQIRR